MTKASFLNDLHTLALRLPETPHALNLCKDRYWFAVSLFACITRGIVSVLPNSIAPGVVSEINNEIPDLLCLGDKSEMDLPLPYLQVNVGTESYGKNTWPVPNIPDNQLILFVYTSGSTGKPKKHAKTFGRMQKCAIAEAERIWGAAGGPCAVLGTVPFQHMYGLESTIFLPLLGGGQLSARLPFYPADVAEALSELTLPRVLFTTPFHLRKLLESDIDYPPISVIVSATSPLPKALAELTETRMKTHMIEIYGSTETGQIATRIPTQEDHWELYEGIQLQQHNGITSVEGGHLEGSQTLNDVVESCGESRFLLLGRNSDMVNVVGKRSSLAFLNQIIAHLPGVRDGVFCIPKDEEGANVSRLAAFVVAPGMRSQDIHSALLQHLDPVFLPRPVVFVDEIPRDANGKILSSALSNLIARHIA